MARAFFAVGVAVVVAVSIPAASARRAQSPYPCADCLFEVGVDGKGLRIVAKQQADDLSPDRRRLVTERSDGVYVVPIGGPAVQRIAPFGHAVAFSPDGRNVLLVRSQDAPSECARRSVWVVRADGSGLRMLADCAMSPAWAPDSKRVAYLGNLVDDGAGDVVVAGLDGSGRAIDRVEAASPPAWSSDGRLLAYTALADPGTPNAIGGSGGGRAQDAPFELRVVRSDGHRVASYAAAETVSWSTQSNMLAYDQDATPFTDVPFALGDFFEEFLRIADVPGRPGPPHRAHAGPWSPDGKLMAFVPDGEDEVDILPRVRGRSGRRVVLLSPGGTIQKIWWAPDGRRLLFSWQFDPPADDATAGSSRITAGASTERRARLYDPRACSAAFWGGGDWRDETGECATRTIDTGYTDVGVYDCSVRYEAPTAARLTSRMLFDGRVQRTMQKVVSGSGSAAIGTGFAALDSQGAGGLPAGRYLCDFAIGNRHARVAFNAPGSRDVVRVPAACSTARTSEHACDFWSPDVRPFAPTHSVTCSAIFAGRQGRPVEIDIFQGTKLLSAGKDRLEYPITSEWARTSAAPRQFFPRGDYLCRFLLDGQVVAERPFTIEP
jgi:WD40-like Beta Propeller Repeat